MAEEMYNNRTMMIHKCAQDIQLHFLFKICQILSKLLHSLIYTNIM
jgi:hypothetical protein